MVHAAATRTLGSHSFNDFNRLEPPALAAALLPNNSWLITQMLSTQRSSHNTVMGRTLATLNERTSAQIW